MTSDLTVRILGVPGLVSPRAGSPFPAKGYQLLALLSRSSSHRMMRKEVATFLWSSSSDAEGLTTLRQLLRRVHQSFAPTDDPIIADAQTVSLDPGAQSVDLIQFEALAHGTSTADLIRGLSLFRGELLSGASDVTEQFADWLTRERTTVREQFFAAASSALIEITRYGRASHQDLRLISERMLDLEPEREATYRALVEAYGRNGQIEEAERTFLLLKEMLQREHGAKPSPATAAVARRVFAATCDRHHLDDQSPPQAERRPRIAFLKPSWLTDDAQSDLTHALIEDVANELARYRTFAVLAAHSSFQIEHDSGMPLSNEQLRADYTVSGFLKQISSERILALRMTKCASGEIVWAAEYPFGIADLQHAFQMISLRIASTLASELERDVFRDLHKSGSSSAYHSYLEGQIQLRHCGLQHLRRARHAFRTAIARDRHCAPAYGRIAQTLYLEWLILGGNDPHLLHEARGHAGRTTRLDPGNALGHWMSAVVALYQRDFHTCGEKFAEAETLNPHSADLLVQHADALSHLGRADDGWLRFERAIELNPLPPDHYWWAGASIAFNQHDFLKSISLCRKLKSEEPVLRILAASHAHAGDMVSARFYGRRLRETYPEDGATSLLKLAPDYDKKNHSMFIEGLRLAGVP